MLEANYRGLAAAVISQALDDLKGHINAYRRAKTHEDVLHMRSEAGSCMSIYRFMTEDNMYLDMLDMNGSQMLRMYLSRAGMTKTFEIIKRDFGGIGQ